MSGGNPFPFVLVDGMLNGQFGGGGGEGGHPLFFPFPGNPSMFRRRPAGNDPRPPDNSGVGHLYDSTVPVREWIRQEQNRSLDDDASSGGSGISPTDGLSAADLSAAARDRGNRAYGSGDLEAAMAHYTEALRRMPCEKAYANRSLVHHSQGNFAAAADDARKAVELTPSYYRGHQRLANALFSLGEYDTAEEAAEEAAKLAPSDEEREKCLIVKVKCEAKKRRQGPMMPDTPTAMARSSLDPPPSGGGIQVVGTSDLGTPGAQFPTTPATPSFSGGNTCGLGFSPILQQQQQTIDLLAADMVPMKERRQLLQAELRKSELVKVADRFTRTQCAKEVKNLLNEVDPDLLAAAQYAVGASQDNLRSAAESGDRQLYEEALSARDMALDVVWKKAQQGVRAVGRVHNLATEESEAIAALRKAIQDIEVSQKVSEDPSSFCATNDAAPTTVGSDDHESPTPQPRETTAEVREASSPAVAVVGGDGDSTTSPVVGDQGYSLSELGDLIKIHRTLRGQLHTNLEPAMTRVDEALQQLARAKVEEDAVFEQAGSLFADLRETSDRIAAIVNSVKSTSSCAVVNHQRLETLDQLMPTFESLLHDKDQFRSELLEGNDLLEEEARLEKDRLTQEKARIQAQAALEWSKVREDLPGKTEGYQKEVTAAISRVRSIVQRQQGVRERLRELMAKDHPELAWKAAAAGSQMMKTVKGTGLWVNESFSDFQVQSVVSAAANHAKVYRATSRIRGTDVALKEIPIESDRDKKHFLTEVGVAVTSAHSSVCPVLGVFFDGPFGYIIMPFYPLGNVQKCLGNSATAWPGFKVQEVFRQIVSGVAHLHSSGVMHHDLKPSNVLMKTGSTALLADFGLSRDLGEFGRKADVTVTCVRGTPDYTPPELLSACEGDQVSAVRADMWSLGATLYSLAAQNTTRSLQEAPSDDAGGGDADAPPMIGQLQAAEGKIVISPSWVGGNERLADLLTLLLESDPEKRPLTQAVLAHPYFTVSLLKDLVDNHQLIESNSKVEAFRTYAHEVTTRTSQQQPTMISVVRSRMVDSVTSILSQVVEAGGGSGGGGASSSGDALLAPLFVVFRGEDGIDEGGLTTDMFTTYYEQLATKAKALVHAGSSTDSSGSDSDVNDSAGLQTPTAAAAAGGGPSTTGAGNSSSSRGLCATAQYLPSSDARISLATFKTMGMMMLKSLVENRPLPLQLSTSVLKFLVGGQPTLADLEEYDKVMVRNLRRLLLMGEEELEGMCLDFSEFDAQFLSRFEDGHLKQEDAVVRSNVATYVHAKVQYELVGKRLRALTAIKEGFYASRSLQPHLQLLSATELQLLLCGQSHVDAEDILSLLDFSQFPAGSRTPLHLQELLRGFSQSNLRRFLRLVTSSVTIPRTPPQGPIGQPSSGNRQNQAAVKIKIQCTRDTQRLPVGHSCSYQLDLPDYNNHVVLREKLGIALAHANEGFNIV